MHFLRDHSRRIILSFYAVFFVLLGLQLFKIQQKEWPLKFGDSAFMAEMLRNMGVMGPPVTQINSSISSVYDIMNIKAEEAENVPLKGPEHRLLNQFSRHTYIIFYLVSPLTKFIAPSTLLAFLLVATFVSFLILSVWILQKLKVPIFISPLVLLLLMSHPIFYGLYSNMYPDRLFMPLCLYYMYILDQKETSLLKITLFSLLLFSTIERAGLVSGMATAFVGLINYKSNPKRSLKLVMLGLVTFFLSMYLIVFVLHNPHNSSYISTFSNPLENYLYMLMNYRPFVFNTLYFFLFNLGFLGLWAFFYPTGLLLFVAASLPNLMGNLGGAEKVGWSTHYHSFYFPLLVWALLKGIAKVAKNPSWVVRIAVMLVLLVQSYFLNTVGINGEKLVYDPQLITNNPFYRLFTDGVRYKGEHPIAQIIRQKKDIAKIVGTNSIVSTNENLFAMLYSIKELHLYPQGMEIADYIILGLPTKVGDKLIYYGNNFNYNGVEEQRKMDEIFTARMTRLGFNTQNPVIVGEWAVLHRVR